MAMEWVEQVTAHCNTQHTATSHGTLQHTDQNKIKNAAVCLRMVLELVQEVTNEEAYDAEEAGLIFDITNSSQSSP